MKSTTLALTTVISLLVAAMAGPSQLGAQQQPSYKVLYTFSGGTDGGFPSGLAGDGKGNFYGITEIGGDLSCNSPSGCGTVFKVTAGGTETVPWAFTGGADGTCSSCTNGVLPDEKGNLYGGASGGAYGWGLVFKIDPNDHLTVLYNFKGGADGGTFSSISTPIRDREGNLYATTDTGGDLTACGGCGVVFKLDPSGNETVLHSFTGGTDGAFPNSGLVRDKAGNLYGPTQFGGANNVGVVFKLDPANNETVLHSFTGALSSGSGPNGPLILDKAGNLYGTTQCCGLGGPPGVVFKLDPKGNETVLYAFTGGADGGSPNAGVVRDKAGNLYATTAIGGNLACPLNRGSGCGVVFKLDLAGHESVLYTFCSQPNCADGAIPLLESLVLEEGEGEAEQMMGGEGSQPEGGQDRTENAIRLYGTTAGGGSQSGVCSGFGCGLAFVLTVPKEED